MEIKHKNEGTINKNSVYIRTDKGELTLYFSYETIISYDLRTFGEKGIYEDNTIKNYWSVTTGKFLNELCPDKSRRLTEEEFKPKLERALNLLSVDIPILVERGL